MREHLVVAAEQGWRGGGMSNRSSEEDLDWKRLVDARRRLETGETLEVVDSSARTILGAWWTFSRVLPLSIACVLTTVWLLRLVGVRRHWLPIVVIVGVFGCVVPVLRWTWRLAGSVRVVLALEEIRVVRAFGSESFRPAVVRSIERATLVPGARGPAIETFALAVHGRRRLVRLAAVPDDTTGRAYAARRVTPEQLQVLAWADLLGVRDRTGQMPLPPVPKAAMPDSTVRSRTGGVIEHLGSDDQVSLHVDGRFIEQPAIADREIISGQMIDDLVALVASVPFVASLRVGDQVRVAETATGLVVEELIVPSTRAVMQVKMHDRSAILEWRTVVESLGVAVHVSPFPGVVRLDVPDAGAVVAVRSALQPWIENQALMLSVVAEPGGSRTRRDNL